MILRGVTSSGFILCLVFGIETPRKITVCARIALKWSIIDMVYTKWQAENITQMYFLKGVYHHCPLYENIVIFILEESS